MSPTQRSIKHLKEQGLRPWVVEYWNPFAKRRIDLYNCIDIIAIGEGKTWAVQTTSTPNISARIKKLQESEYFPIMENVGWKVVVHGWAKKKNKYVLTERILC